MSWSAATSRNAFGGGGRPRPRNMRCATHSSRAGDVMASRMKLTLFASFGFHLGWAASSVRSKGPSGACACHESVNTSTSSARKCASAKRSTQPRASRVDASVPRPPRKLKRTCPVTASSARRACATRLSGKSESRSAPGMRCQPTVRRSSNQAVGGRTRASACASS